MRSKKRTIGILIVVIVILLGFAGSLLVYRNKLSSENVKNTSSDNIAQSLSFAPSGISIENFYDKLITDEKIALDSIEANRNKLGYADKNFTFIYDENSGSETAYHFDLYYKGIPVQSPAGSRGVSVITYYDNSPDVLITGVSDSEKIIKIDTTPKITQDEASNIIKNKLGEKIDIKPKLIIYETNGEFILAYYVNTLFNVCIINAGNGNIVVCQSTLLSNSDEFIGQNGDKHRIFYDDYQDGNYNIENALWDKEKNIFIYNNICTYKEIKDKDNILSLEDIQSGHNKSAVDGMANTYRAVEYFEKLKKFDSVVVVVNIDKAKDENGNVVKDNAGGSFANIDGSNIAIITFYVSSDETKPQYSAYLDAVAHEYTHAVTDSEIFGSDGYSKDSKYYEQNALMEAYSDIFGELIEHEYTGKTDWNSKETRNLIEQEKDRKYYNYKYSDMYTGTDDNGGAHYNSTIISHATYLMSKDNKNIKRSVYASSKYLLDYDKLGQLWYGSLEYLKETKFMNFSDCRYAVEKSARKLIEQGVLVEDNLKVIEQAFNEVGVDSDTVRHGVENSLKVTTSTATTPSEPVEIEEIKNYEWHLAPTIEAEDIIVSDNSIYTIFSDTKASDTYSIIKKNGKYTMIDYDGQLVTEDLYDRYYFADAGEIGLWRNNTSPYSIMALGDEVSKDDYGMSRGMTGGWAGFCYNSSDKTVYADRCFEYEIFDGNINDFSGYKEVKIPRAVLVQSANVERNDNEDYNFYDVELLGKYGIAYNNQLFVDTIYEEGKMSLYNDMIALKKDNKWGYFEGTTGEQVIDFIGNDISLNSETIHDNKTGEVIKEITYPYTFSDGYVALYTDSGCGYYDTQGNEVIPCGTFEEVRPVHNGLAWVKKDGKWGVIKLKDIGADIGNNNSSKNENWQQLYADELKTYIASDKYNNDAMFDLFDINNDGTPELIISTGSFHIAQCFIYTIFNGELIKSNRTYGEYGGITCSQSKQTIVSGTMFHGYATVSYYQLVDNTFITMIIGSNDIGAVGEEKATYQINDEMVTAEKYNEELSKYEADDYVEIGRKHKLDEATINLVLLNIETPKKPLFTGTVNTEKDPLNVRKSPSDKAEIIGQVKKGSNVTIYSETNGWYEIEYNGGVGYVSKKYIISKGNSSDSKESSISDNQILKAVNKYLEKNQSHLGDWLSDSGAYCPAEYMASNNTKWSCPINNYEYKYSPFNYIVGSYPYYVFVDKETLICTITANYYTEAEFNLADYIK